ncbi:hypothetical protein JCM10213v2_008766 [Rhodosporidiobolus nylandii]
MSGQSISDLLLPRTNAVAAFAGHRSSGPSPQFTNTPAGQAERNKHDRAQQAKQEQHTGSRLPPPSLHLAHLAPRPSAATLPNRGEGSLFLSSGTTVHAGRAKFFESRQQASGSLTSWTGKAQFGQQDRHPYASTSQQFSPQQYDAPPPSLAPAASYSLAAQIPDISLRCPSSLAGPASVAHDTDDDLVIMSTQKRPGVPFGPSDPEPERPPPGRRGPQRNLGGGGWGSAGFNDDEPRGGAKGGKKDGGSYQSAGPPKQAAKKGKGTAPAPNRVFLGAMNASVSVNNRGGTSGSGRSGTAKGKGKALDVDLAGSQEEEQGNERLDTTAAINAMPSFKKNLDQSVYYSPSTSHAPPPNHAPHPVPSSSFHGTPHASSSRVLSVSQSGPDTAQMRQGQARQREIQQQRTEKTSGKGKGKAPEISVKGAAKTITLSDDSDEGEAQAQAPSSSRRSSASRLPKEVRGPQTHRNENEEDPVQDSDDEPGGKRAKGKHPQRRHSDASAFDLAPAGRSVAGQKGRKSASVLHAGIVDDVNDPAPSSPDPLAFNSTGRHPDHHGRTSAVSTKDLGVFTGVSTLDLTQKFEQINRSAWEDRQRAQVPKQSMVGGMKPKQARPSIGGAGNEDLEMGPNNVSNNPMNQPVPSKGGRVPRAAQQAAAMGKNAGGGGSGIGGNMFSLQIHPPLVSRQGVLDPGLKYSLTLNASGKQQKITITRRRGGGEKDDFLEFRSGDAYSVEYFVGNRDVSPYCSIQFKTSSLKKEWPDLCADAEIGESEGRTLHFVLQSPGAVDPDIERGFFKHFHKSWPMAVEDSGGKARTISGQVRDYCQFALDAEARSARHGKASGTATSKKTSKGVQQTLNFDGKSETDRQIASIPEICENQDGLIATSSSAEGRRTSSRPSTSALAPEHRRLRRGSDKQPLRHVHVDDSDDEMQEAPRLPTPEPERFKPEEVVIEYPLERKPGATSVALTWGDTKRLREDEFLNDTLIEFGLKRAVEKLVEQDEGRPPEERLADKVHVFNSFFYKQLSSRKPRNGPDNYGYSLVAKWTKKFDLFNKKYIVVPINEHLHWYLAIIVNPVAILRPPKAAPPPPPPRRGNRARTSTAKAAENGDTITVLSSSQPHEPGTTSEHFAHAGEEDVDMFDGEQHRNEEDDSGVAQAAHEAAVRVKEGIPAGQPTPDGDGDEPMLAVSSMEVEPSEPEPSTENSDDDLEVTAARPEVEGGGRSPASTKKGKHVKQQDKHSLDDEDEDDIQVQDAQDRSAVFVEDSEPPEAQHQLAPPGQSAAVHDILTLSGDEDSSSLPDPAQAAKIRSKGKQKAQEADKENHGDMDVNRDDDKASSTSASSDDSAAAVQNQLIDQPSSAQLSRPTLAKKPTPIFPTAPPSPPRRQPSPPPQAQSTTPQDVEDTEDEDARYRELPEKKLDDCYIIIIDSLDGPHTAVPKRLRDYLALEAMTKRGMAKDQISPDDAHSMHIEAPEQPNFCDCGLYLLHFVEKFFSDPDFMLRKILEVEGSRATRKLKKESKPWKERQVFLQKVWDDDVARAKRSVMRDEVARLIDEYEPIRLRVEAERQREDAERRKKRKEEQERRAAERAAAGETEQDGQEFPSAVQSHAPSPLPAEEDEPPKKRGRGRPKKEKKAEVVELSDTDDETPSPHKPPPARAAPLAKPASPVPFALPPAPPTRPPSSTATSRGGALDKIVDAAIGHERVPSPQGQPQRRATYGASPGPSAPAPQQEPQRDRSISPELGAPLSSAADSRRQRSSPSPPPAKRAKTDRVAQSFAPSSAERQHLSASASGARTDASEPVKPFSSSASAKEKKRRTGPASPQPEQPQPPKRQQRKRVTAPASVASAHSDEHAPHPPSDSSVVVEPGSAAAASPVRTAQEGSGAISSDEEGIMVAAAARVPAEEDDGDLPDTQSQQSSVSPEPERRPPPPVRPPTPGPAGKGSSSTATSSQAVSMTDSPPKKGKTLPGKKAKRVPTDDPSAFAPYSAARVEHTQHSPYFPLHTATSTSTGVLGGQHMRFTSESDDPSTTVHCDVKALGATSGAAGLEEQEDPMDVDDAGPPPANQEAAYGQAKQQDVDTITIDD